MAKNLTKRLSIWAAVVASILMIPFFGKAPWTIGDYVFAGVVLFGAASAYEFITKNMPDTKHQLAVGAAILFGVMLIWAWAVAGP